ncbi:MAG: RidA family protein [Dehalococcoidia bacterium]|nr:RidA family protein [Dehalococcoidia bacterium]
MSELNRVIVNTDKAPQPIGAYSQAIRTAPGELLFIAGQVSVGLDGNPVGVGDMAAQVRQVFANLGGILEGVDATFSNVVEFTTYVVGRDSVQAYIAARTDLYPELFPDADYPPNTLLVVDGLVREEFLLEIKAVAALP